MEKAENLEKNQLNCILVYKESKTHTRDSSTRKIFKLRLWGDRIGYKDVSDLLFLFLRCSLTLLQIFKAFVHRSKSHIILGHSSGANLGADMEYFGNLQQPKAHCSYSQFSTYSHSETDLLPNLTHLARSQQWAAEWWVFGCKSVSEPVWFEFGMG